MRFAGTSAGFTFRQLDTFWYLTGLEFPDAVAALDSDRGVTVVYAPARDARFEEVVGPDAIVEGVDQADDIRP